MSTPFRPPRFTSPRYTPQFQRYLSQLRSQYRIPEPVAPAPVPATPPPTPAQDEGAFEKAMATAAYLYELPGVPFRALAENQFKKHIRDQAGWYPGAPFPDPAATIPTPTGEEMAKAAAFDVGRPPATHGEAVARGLVGMAGGIAQDPVAMALIGGGMGAIPAGAARTAAHYGMMGLLGTGVVTGAIETAEELERQGEWSPEVTETVTRPVVDAALMATPYVWPRIRAGLARLRPGDPVSPPPPGPKASTPLDNDLAGWDLESPRRVVPLRPKRADYSKPEAERRGKYGTLALIERIDRRIRDLGRPMLDEAGRPLDPPEVVAERAELRKSRELLDNWGASMEETGRWPDPLNELRGINERIPFPARVAQEIDAQAVRLRGAEEVGDLGEAAAAESILLRLANRLGRDSVRSTRPTTESGLKAQETVSEALDVLWREIDAASAAGDYARAEALGIRYKSLERAFHRGQGNDPARVDMEPRPGETVQEAASRLWAEILFAEESGNVQWIQALQARYAVMEAAIARGQGEMPATAVERPVAAPGPQAVPPAEPAPTPGEVAAGEAARAGLPLFPPRPGAPPPTEPAPPPTRPTPPAPPAEGALAPAVEPLGPPAPPAPPAPPPAPLPPAPEPVTRVTKKAARFGPEAQAKAEELAARARREKRAGRLEEARRIIMEAEPDFDVYGLGPSELRDLAAAVEAEEFPPEAPPAPPPEAPPEERRPLKVHPRVTEIERRIAEADRRLAELGLPPEGERRRGPRRIEELREAGIYPVGVEAPTRKAAEAVPGAFLHSDETTVDLGRGPKGEGWVILAHGNRGDRTLEGIRWEDGEPVSTGPRVYGTKSEAQDHLKRLKKLAQQNRARLRGANLEEWEARIASADPTGLKTIEGPMGVEFNLEVQEELARGGRAGGMVRAIAAAHQLGQEVHPGWYERFPWIQDLPFTGKRGNITAKMIRQPEVPTEAPPPEPTPEPEERLGRYRVRFAVVNPIQNSERVGVEDVEAPNREAAIRQVIDKYPGTESSYTDIREVTELAGPPPPEKREGVVGPYEHLTADDQLQMVIEGRKPAFLWDGPMVEVEALAEKAERAGLPYEVLDLGEGYEDLMVGMDEPSLQALKDARGDAVAEGRALGYTEADIQAYLANRRALEGEGWEQIEAEILAGKYQPGDTLPDGTTFVGMSGPNITIQDEEGQTFDIPPEEPPARPTPTIPETLKTYSYRWTDAEGTRQTTEVTGLSRAEADDKFNEMHPEAENVSVEKTDETDLTPPEPTQDRQVEELREGDQVFTPGGLLGVVDSLRTLPPNRANPQGKVVAKVFIPEQPGQGADTVQEFRPDTLTRIGDALFYVSGQSRTKDLLVASLWDAPFGVDVGELSSVGIQQLGTAVARFRGNAFVDSGAYSLFKKSLKQEGVTPLDFQNIFNRYRLILQAAAKEAGRYERNWHPPIRFVMPDVVGDQEASLQALKDSIEDVAATLRNPFAEAVVPIQKGDRTLFEQLWETIKVVGHPRTFTIGLPGNAKAITTEDLTEFVEDLAMWQADSELEEKFFEALPLRFHFLGVGPGDRLSELSSIVRESFPRAVITADANRVRSLLRGETTREEAVRGALGLPDDADVSKPELLEAGEMPAKIAAMSEDERDGFIEFVREVLEDEPGVKTPEALVEVLDNQTVKIDLEEARWLLATIGSVTEPEPAPTPESVPEPADPGTVEAVDRIAAVREAMTPDQWEAFDKKLLNRIPAKLHDQIRAGVLRQLNLIEQEWDTSQDVDYLKGLGKRRTARQNRRYTELRAKLEAQGELLAAGWEDFAGILKDVPDRAKIAKRLRDILEKKKIGRKRAEDLGITNLAEQSAGPIAHMLAIPESEAIAAAREWAREVEVDEARVIESLERDLEEFDAEATQARRAELAPLASVSNEEFATLSEGDQEKVRNAQSELRAIDKNLRNNFLDMKGYGGRRTLEILTAGPQAKDFQKVINYRIRAYRELEAMQELILSHFDQIEDQVPNAGEVKADLRSVAAALTEDLADTPEPSGQRPMLTGDREGEYPDPGAGEAPEAHLFKTFMWGIKVPGTKDQSITTQEAIDAINLENGRIWARIWRAYEEATEPEAEDTPFDVPTLSPDEISKLGVTEASRSDRPFGGRYGPAPRRPTKKQAARIGRTPGTGVPPLRRPKDAPEGGGGASESERPGAGRRDPRERPGRPGVRSDRGPGVSSDPEVPPTSAPKRGVFGVVLARPEETAQVPPDYSLIPEKHRKILGEHQHVAVAKIIARLNEGEGFLLADGTGVGKTHTILSVASKYAQQDKRPVVIIAPPNTLNIRMVDGVERPTGSFADASEQLEVPYVYVRSGTRPFTPEAGRIYVTPYWRLAEINAPPETVVIFDEAHYLKNYKGSTRGLEGKELGDKAFAVLFATATPGDTADQLLWAERVGILEGKPVPKQMHDLGMIVRKKTVWKDGVPEVKYFWAPQSEGKTNRRIKELFSRLTAQNAVLKREIDFSAVDVEVRATPLPPEAHEILNRIADEFPGEGIWKAIMLQHQRRQQEPYKLDATKQAIQEELAKGRSVVVFADRVNYSEVAKKIKDATGEVIAKEVIAKSEGTIKQLRAWLEEAGIKYAEIHGAAEEASDDAISRFQANRAPVVIATVYKGGQGINLDDRTGERPRSMIMMTAPFSSVEMFQAAGRIHRYTTITPSKIIMLKSDTDVDDWNFTINASKMAQLGARVSGQVELLRPDLLNEWSDTVVTADEQLPEAVWSDRLVDETLNNITNYRDRRAIISNKQRDWMRKTLAKLTPKWSEDGGVFTIVTTDGPVYHGYWEDGAFEIDRDDATTHGRVGFKKVVQRKVPKGITEASRRKDRANQKLIDGFLDSVGTTPILTEGNLPGDMFNAEETAKRERQEAGKSKEKPPEQKDLFSEASRRADPNFRPIRPHRADEEAKAGGHDATDGEVDAILQKLYELGGQTKKVRRTNVRPDLPWQDPQLVGEGRLPFDALTYEDFLSLSPGEREGRILPGGGISLYSALSERLHRFQEIDWTSGDYKVRNALDVGAVSQIARNPNIEQAFMVGTDGEKIVGVLQTSSELPSAVAWWEQEGRDEDFLRFMHDWAKRHGATKLYGVHNHPSGDPAPSDVDKEMHNFFAQKLEGYSGSVVINHEKFHAITTKKGKVHVQRVYRRPAAEGIPDPFLSAEGWYKDPVIANPEKFGEAIARRSEMFRPEPGEASDWPLLIFRDASHRVREIISVPRALYLDRPLFVGYVREWGKLSGGAFAILALDNPDITERMLANEYVKEDSIYAAVDVTGARQGIDALSNLRTEGLIRFGGDEIDYGAIPMNAWREDQDNRRYSLRVSPRPARAGGGGGRGGGGDDGGDGPFDWPEALRPGPGESGWRRAVRFAELRMRRRAAQINMGIDPKVFWDAFIIGADRFAGGLRNMGQWLASVGEFKGFGDLWRKVWDSMAGIVRPQHRTIKKRPKVPDADTIVEQFTPKPKVVRPIRQPTKADIEKAIQAMLNIGPPFTGTGKPPVRNKFTGELSGTDININTIGNEAQARDVIARIVRALESQFGEARTYRSWEKAKEIARDSGYTEKHIRRLLEEKGALTDYEIIAGRILRQEATIDFSNKWGEYQDLMRRAAAETDPNSKAAWETMAAEANRDAKAALAKAIGIQYTTVAAGSEAARALAIHRMMVQEMTPKERLLWQILRDKKYGDDATLNQIAEALERNDMSRVGELYNKLYKSSLLDKMLEWWLNSILSGPPTQAANITGNTTMQAINVPEAAIASRLEEYGVRQALERWMTGDAVPQERVIGEATRAMSTLLQTKFGAWDALRLSWDAIWNPAKYAFGAKGEYRPPAIGGTLGKIVRAPSRWMEGADLGAKMSAARVERNKIAWRRAVGESRDAAKRGEKWNYDQTLNRAKQFEDIIHEYAAIEARRKIDPKSITPEERMFLVKNKWGGSAVRAMDKAADVATFRDENADIIKYASLIRARYPWLTFMIPFLRTPERIFVQAMRRTPVGLARTLYNIRTGKIKGGEASDRLAQGMLGTLMSASVYMMARDGQITGSGPSDPRKRRDWLATGKRPYAMKMPLPGGPYWVSFARIEPLATTFGFAADLAEAQDDKVAGDIWDKLHYSMIQNITNKTFLEGMISTAEAVGDPDRYGARFYKRMVGGFVPNLFATAARAIDPTIRQTDTIQDTLLSRVPWFSMTVKPRLSGTGELIDRGEDPFSRFISPFRYAREAGPEANLERMFLETGYHPSAPPRYMTLPGTMGRKVMLTDKEREIYALYARRATGFARTLAANRDWSRMDVFMKAEFLRRLYRFAHDAGRKAMYRSVLYRIQRGDYEIKGIV